MVYQQCSGGIAIDQEILTEGELIDLLTKLAHFDWKVKNFYQFNVAVLNRLVQGGQLYSEPSSSDSISCKGT
jgi:hypothetical protein